MQIEGQGGSTKIRSQSQGEAEGNKKTLFCVNMERILLKTGKMVCDHMVSSELPVISFVIKKGLTRSWTDSHSKYIETIKAILN